MFNTISNLGNNSYSFTQPNFFFLNIGSFPQQLSIIYSLLLLLIIITHTSLLFIRLSVEPKTVQNNQENKILSY